MDYKIIIKKDGKKYTVRNNRDRFFYPKEWMKFSDVIKKNQEITFKCLINTGARINELRNVKVGDIDFVRRTIILRVTKVKSKKGEKNPRPRIIPISNQFSRYLKGYVTNKKLSNGDYLGILSTPAANIGMKKALQRAKISDWKMFSIHNIRKSLETWLISLDVDGLKVTSHFGHSVSTAAQHYTAADIFSYDDKQKMRMIIGDLYSK